MLSQPITLISQPSDGMQPIVWKTLEQPDRIKAIPTETDMKGSAMIYQKKAKALQSPNIHI